MMAGVTSNALSCTAAQASVTVATSVSRRARRRPGSSLRFDPAAREAVLGERGAHYVLAQSLQPPAVAPTDHLLGVHVDPAHLGHRRSEFGRASDALRGVGMPSDFPSRRPPGVRASRRLVRLQPHSSKRLAVTQSAGRRTPPAMTSESERALLTLPVDAFGVAESLAQPTALNSATAVDDPSTRQVIRPTSRRCSHHARHVHFRRGWRT